MGLCVKRERGQGLKYCVPELIADVTQLPVP